MRRSPTALAIVFCLLMAVTLQASPERMVIPRIDTPPTIDGSLGDAVWSKAAKISTFTQPRSADLPKQKIEASIAYDDEAIYIAVVCFTKSPEKLRAVKTVENDAVWVDDCVEVWIRTTDDSNDYDQFVTNSIGTRETNRIRTATGPVVRSGAPWQVKTKVGTDRWVAEMKIPYSDIGLDAAPQPGQMIELKIGREDYTNADGDTYAIWPAGARYSKGDDLSPVYFDSLNLLPNPDLSKKTDGRPAAWGFTKDAEKRFKNVRQNNETIIEFDAPGEYAAMSQQLRLTPNTLYRLTGEFKGKAGGYLRTRTRTAGGETQAVKHDAHIAPSETWHKHEIVFITGPRGECEIVLGTDTNQPAGKLQIRHLQLIREATQLYLGQAVAVPVDNNEPFIIKHLALKNARALRGRLGSVIDGTTETLDWANRFWEYKRPGAATGVNYDYRGNDGLHIQLHDRDGVNAIQIFSGIAADVLIDNEQYDDPTSGTLVHQFPGKAKNSMVFFDQPVTSDKFSFFNVRDGYIADISFFRVGGDVGKLGEAMISPIAGKAQTRSIRGFMNMRFAGNERTAIAAFTGKNQADTPFRMTQGVPVHVLAGPFEADLPLSAVGLRMTLANIATSTVIKVQVQDFVHPRTAITTGVIEAAGPGRLNVVFDIPDQIISKGKQVWVTLTADADVTVKAPALVLYRTSREQAVTEALAFHKLKLAGFYTTMSEGRPWNTMRRNDTWETFIARFENDAVQLTEIRNGIDHCLELDPNDPIVRQYRDWLYRTKERRPLPEPKIDDIANAPQWAVVARQAWLTARTVPRFWIDNRQVPTGEFGGNVNDDTCMMQNFADFPVFERDGLGGDVLQAATMLADFADQFYIKDGLNSHETDPLHAYEDGINQLATMVWWHYGDPIIVERAMESARAIEAITMVNDQGRRHFKGGIISSLDLKREPPINYDGEAHAQMMHPVCEIAWYNGNPRATRLMREYADTWLYYNQTPGQYATAVEVKTGKVISTADEPFVNGFAALTSHMLFTATITGESKYLQPLIDYLNQANHVNWPQMYLADLYHLGYFDEHPGIVSKFSDRSPALRYAATGDKTAMVNALREDIAEIQTFGHMYKEAEVFTDRVFLYAIQNATRSYTGGYATRNKPFHSHAITWSGLGTDYAAIIRTARHDELHGAAYNFSDQPLRGHMHLWRLDHGVYELTTGIDTDGDDEINGEISTKQITVVRSDPIDIELAPRQTTIIRLRLKQRLEPLNTRADLAISARTLSISDGKLTGTVHNIGSRDVEDVKVSIVDPAGKVVKTLSVGRLEAPLDLNPRRKTFTFENIDRDMTGWSVVVDAENTVPEITETNNRAMIP